MPGITEDESYDPVYPLGRPKNRNISPPKELTQAEKDEEKNWEVVPGSKGIQKNKITGKIRTVWTFLGVPITRISKRFEA